MFRDFRFIARTVVHRTLMKTWITNLLTLSCNAPYILLLGSSFIRSLYDLIYLEISCFDDVVLYVPLASFSRTLTILNQLGVPPGSRLGSEQAQRLIQGAPNGHFSLP